LGSVDYLWVQTFCPEDFKHPGQHHLVKRSHIVVDQDDKTMVTPHSSLYFIPGLVDPMIPYAHRITQNHALGDQMRKNCSKRIDAMLTTLTMGMIDVSTHMNMLNMWWSYSND
jgi:hypothetical protein